MHTGVIWPRGVNIGNRPLIEAKMKGCQVREWIVGEKHMSFSRILYMVCVNGGYLVSEIFNNIDRKPGGKSKNRYNGRLWKINWWYVPTCPRSSLIALLQPSPIHGEQFSLQKYMEFSKPTGCRTRYINVNHHVQIG